MLKTAGPVREAFLQINARRHLLTFPGLTCAACYLHHAALMTGKPDFKRIRRSCKAPSIPEEEKRWSLGVTFDRGTPITAYPSSIRLDKARLFRFWHPQVGRWPYGFARAHQEGRGHHLAPEPYRGKDWIASRHPV